MEVVSLPLDQLKEARWNPNTMAPSLQAKVKASIRRYGMVGVLVVRLLRPCSGQVPDDVGYEVLSGNQRLRVLRELGHAQVDCVVVDLDDGHARLLADSLNQLHGESDLGLRAELLQQVLEAIPREEVLAVLPETAEGLEALANLGQEGMANYLQNWQQAQAARLKHLQFQLTPAQLEVIEEALAPFLPKARSQESDSPNRRGTALYLLCRASLKAGGV